MNHRGPTHHSTGPARKTAQAGEFRLVLYSSLPSGLVAYYQQAGFSVAHIPAHDHHSPRAI